MCRGRRTRESRASGPSWPGLLWSYPVAGPLRPDSDTLAPFEPPGVAPPDIDPGAVRRNLMVSGPVELIVTRLIHFNPSKPFFNNELGKWPSLSRFWFWLSQGVGSHF